MSWTDNYNMPHCFEITPIYIFCTINMLPLQTQCADWLYISPGQLHSVRSRDSWIYLLGLFDLKTSLVFWKNKHAKNRLKFVTNVPSRRLKEHFSSTSKNELQKFEIQLKQNINLKGKTIYTNQHNIWKKH